MFGFKPKAKEEATRSATLEDRIRAVCPHPHIANILIELDMTEGHTRRALVVPHPHHFISILLEPDPKTYIADCFVVRGDELHDDPMGFSIWPGHDEKFMGQFKGKPRAVVAYFSFVAEDSAA